LAVRVKVLIKKEEAEVGAVAIANSGYESDEPEVVVPIKVAEKLGMWPEFSLGTRVEAYESPAGTSLFYVVPKAASIAVETKDKSTTPVVTTIVISDKEKEVLLSDKLLDSLDIELKRPGAGIWRFADDPPDKERVSEHPEYW